MGGPNRADPDRIDKYATRLRAASLRVVTAGDAAYQSMQERTAGWSVQDRLLADFEKYVYARACSPNLAQAPWLNALSVDLLRTADTLEQYAQACRSHEQVDVEILVTVGLALVTMVVPGLAPASLTLVGDAEAVAGASLAARMVPVVLTSIGMGAGLAFAGDVTSGLVVHDGDVSKVDWRQVGLDMLWNAATFAVMSVAALALEPLLSGLGKVPWVGGGRLWRLSGFLNNPIVKGVAQGTTATGVMFGMGALGQELDAGQVDVGRAALSAVQGLAFMGLAHVTGPGGRALTLVELADGRVVQLTAMGEETYRPLGVATTLEDGSLRWERWGGGSREAWFETDPVSGSKGGRLVFDDGSTLVVVGGKVQWMVAGQGGAAYAVSEKGWEKQSSWQVTGWREQSFIDGDRLRSAPPGWIRTEYANGQVTLTRPGGGREGVFVLEPYGKGYQVQAVWDLRPDGRVGLIHVYDGKGGYVGAWSPLLDGSGAVVLVAGKGGQAVMLDAGEAGLGDGHRGMVVVSEGGGELGYVLVVSGEGRQAVFGAEGRYLGEGVLFERGSGQEVAAEDLLRPPETGEVELGQVVLRVNHGWLVIPDEVVLEGQRVVATGAEPGATAWVYGGEEGGGLRLVAGSRDGQLVALRVGEELRRFEEGAGPREVGNGTVYVLGAEGAVEGMGWVGAGGNTLTMYQPDAEVPGLLVKADQQTMIDGETGQPLSVEGLLRPVNENRPIRLELDGPQGLAQVGLGEQVLQVVGEDGSRSVYVTDGYGSMLRTAAYNPEGAPVALTAGGKLYWLWDGPELGGAEQRVVLMTPGGELRYVALGNGDGWAVYAPEGQPGVLTYLGEGVFTAGEVELGGGLSVLTGGPGVDLGYELRIESLDGSYREPVALEGMQAQVVSGEGVEVVLLGPEGKRLILHESTWVDEGLVLMTTEGELKLPAGSSVDFQVLGDEGALARVRVPEGQSEWSALYRVEDGKLVLVWGPELAGRPAMEPFGVTTEGDVIDANTWFKFANGQKAYTEPVDDGLRVFDAQGNLGFTFTDEGQVIVNEGPAGSHERSWTWPSIEKVEDLTSAWQPLSPGTGDWPLEGTGSGPRPPDFYGDYWAGSKAPPIQRHGVHGDGEIGGNSIPADPQAALLRALYSARAALLHPDPLKVVQALRSLRIAMQAARPVGALLQQASQVQSQLENRGWGDVRAWLSPEALSLEAELRKQLHLLRGLLDVLQSKIDPSGRPEDRAEDAVYEVQALVKRASDLETRFRYSTNGLGPAPLDIQTPMDQIRDLTSHAAEAISQAMTEASPRVLEIRAVHPEPPASQMGSPSPGVGPDGKRFHFLMPFGAGDEGGGGQRQDHQPPAGSKAFVEALLDAREALMDQGLKPEYLDRLAGELNWLRRHESSGIGEGLRAEAYQREAEIVRALDESTGSGGESFFSRTRMLALQFDNLTLDDEATERTLVQVFSAAEALARTAREARSLAMRLREMASEPAPGVADRLDELAGRAEAQVASFREPLEQDGRAYRVRRPELLVAVGPEPGLDEEMRGWLDDVSVYLSPWHRFTLRLDGSERVMAVYEMRNATSFRLSFDGTMTSLPVSQEQLHLVDWSLLLDRLQRLLTMVQLKVSLAGQRIVPLSVLVATDGEDLLLLDPRGTHSVDEADPVEELHFVHVFALVAGAGVFAELAGSFDAAEPLLHRRGTPDPAEIAVARFGLQSPASAMRDWLEIHDTSGPELYREMLGRAEARIRALRDMERRIEARSTDYYVNGLADAIGRWFDQYPPSPHDLNDPFHLRDLHPVLWPADTGLIVIGPERRAGLEALQRFGVPGPGELPGVEWEVPFEGERFGRMLRNVATVVTVALDGEEIAGTPFPRELFSDAMLRSLRELRGGLARGRHELESLDLAVLRSGELIVVGGRLRQGQNEAPAGAPRRDLTSLDSLIEQVRAGRGSWLRRLLRRFTFSTAGLVLMIPPGPPPGAGDEGGSGQRQVHLPAQPPGPDAAPSLAAEVERLADQLGQGGWARVGPVVRLDGALFRVTIAAKPYRHPGLAGLRVDVTIVPQKTTRSGGFKRAPWETAHGAALPSLMAQLDTALASGLPGTEEIHVRYRWNEAPLVPEVTMHLLRQPSEPPAPAMPTLQPEADPPLEVPAAEGPASVQEELLDALNRRRLAWDSGVLALRVPWISHGGNMPLSTREAAELLGMDWRGVQQSLMDLSDRPASGPLQRLLRFPLRFGARAAASPGHGVMTSRWFFSLRPGSPFSKVTLENGDVYAVIGPRTQRKRIAYTGPNLSERPAVPLGLPRLLNPPGGLVPLGNGFFLEFGAGMNVQPYIQTGQVEAWIKAGQGSFVQAFKVSGSGPARLGPYSREGTWTKVPGGPQSASFMGANVAYGYGVTLTWLGLPVASMSVVVDAWTESSTETTVPPNSIAKGLSPPFQRREEVRTNPVIGVVFEPFPRIGPLVQYLPAAIPELPLLADVVPGLSTALGAISRALGGRLEWNAFNPLIGWIVRFPAGGVRLWPWSSRPPAGMLAPLAPPAAPATPAETALATPRQQTPGGPATATSVTFDMVASLFDDLIAALDRSQRLLEVSGATLAEIDEALADWGRLAERWHPGAAAGAGHYGLHLGAPPTAVMLTIEGLLRERTVALTGVGGSGGPLPDPPPTGGGGPQDASERDALIAQLEQVQRSWRGYSGELDLARRLMAQRRDELPVAPARRLAVLALEDALAAAAEMRATALLGLDEQMARLLPQVWEGHATDPVVAARLLETATIGDGVRQDVRQLEQEVTVAERALAASRSAPVPGRSLHVRPNGRPFELLAPPDDMGTAPSPQPELRRRLELARELARQLPGGGIEEAAQAMEGLAALRVEVLSAANGLQASSAGTDDVGVAVLARLAQTVLLNIGRLQAESEPLRQEAEQAMDAMVAALGRAEEVAAREQELPGLEEARTRLDQLSFAEMARQMQAALEHSRTLMVLLDEDPEPPDPEGGAPAPPSPPNAPPGPNATDLSRTLPPPGGGSLFPRGAVPASAISDRGSESSGRRWTSPEVAGSGTSGLRRWPPGHGT